MTKKIYYCDTCGQKIFLKTVLEKMKYRFTIFICEFCKGDKWGIKRDASFISPDGTKHFFKVEL